MASPAPCDRSFFVLVTNMRAAHGVAGRCKPSRISLPHMLFTLVLSVALAGQPLSPLQPADSVRPDSDVRMVALRHASEIKRCYETHGLKVNPGLGGTIEVEVTVLPSGRVGGASVTASSLAGLGRTEVEACITMSVKNWRFERGPFVTETIVYPFNLVRDRGSAINTSVSSD